MLSNEQLTPTTDDSLIQHELESRIKMHLAGIVACGIQYNEHSSSAQADLNEAKELLKNMCEKYGMGSFIMSDPKEQAMIMRRLYDETLALLKSMPHVIQKVEAVLFEKESITKNEVKKYIDAVL